MKKTILIGACSDLGVDIDGTSLGPKTILSNLNKPSVLIKPEKNIQKNHDRNNLKKNLDELNKFNENLYTLIKEKDNFCLTVGGDHSISIATALASLKKNPNLGLIWIDSHLDYNTFQTTITGNLHGLPLASLNGLNKDLSLFHKEEYFNPKNTVVVGYRSFEENCKDEIENIKTMGVTVFTTNDIKMYGVTEIMDKAFKIANNKTNGVHISFDLDVIDPIVAPGVSVPEVDGLNLEDIAKILKFLEGKRQIIKSFDLVEYNPLKDKNLQTLKIATDIIKRISK